MLLVGERYLFSSRGKAMRFLAGRRRLYFIILLVILTVGGVAGYLALTASRPAANAKQVSPASGKPGGAVPASKKAKAPGEPEGKAAVPVSVTSIQEGEVSSYITSTANLVPENDVKVLAESQGKVAEVRVEEGDRVAKGEILAQLDQGDAEITLKKAQVKASNARLNFERAGKVLAENLMSREQYEKIATENEVARQEEAEAAWRLEKTTIRAPFSGHLTERMIRAGQHIRPGDVLFSVADFDPLIARIYLPEKDVLGLTEGRGVRITLKANETTQVKGRIRQISPVVDPATGTVKVTVEAVTPPPELRPGAFVSLAIVRETHPKALLVPREAILWEMQDSYLFIVDGAVARRRPVSLGLEEEGQVEVVRGLAAGDQVIVAGQGGLKDGASVKVLPSAQASDSRASRAPQARG
jgi:membrane fusion protein, multidrug efflux system